LRVEESRAEQASIVGKELNGFTGGNVTRHLAKLVAENPQVATEQPTVLFRFEVECVHGSKTPGFMF
jgi:hypothetical protein